MAHIINLPPTLWWLKGFWLYAIKPLWWLWLLALAFVLLQIGLDRFFKWLKKKISKK